MIARRDPTLASIPLHEVTPMIAPGRPSRHTNAFALGLAALALAACSDAVATAPPVPESGRLESSEGRGYFQRYVALGTSVSAGVASDGLVAASQQQAWPAQLARLAHRELTLPLVAAPGCNAPLMAPLASGVRTNGVSVLAPFACAGSAPGIVLPTNLVAVDGARVSEALNGPSSNTERQLKHGVILPVGMTQVEAMKLQDPKVVSVELGANELLGASRGILIPHVTVVPFATFQAGYDQLLQEVASVRPKAALLVGLIDDVGTFPAFRTGAELWARRAAFLQLGIVITDACNAANAQNLVFVPVKVPTLAATARATNSAQLYDCADVPGTVDYTLTPGDRAAVNALLAQMNAYIEQQAEARGWAYFRLAALYEAPGVRVAYDPVQQLTTNQPYGPYISLDGYHPSAAGQAMLAQAAARALNETYGMEIPTLLESVLAAR